MKIGIDVGGSHIGIGIIDGNKIIGIKEKNFNREDRQNFEKTIIDSIKKNIPQLLEENSLNIKQIEGGE